MTKFGVIIPICIIAASGCALNEGPEMTSEEPTVAVSVAESEAVPPVSKTDLKKPESPVESTRSVSMDDIRRLQMRLRELGFEPGPVDGVAGTKTKAAFNRLQAGCTKLEPLSEHLPITVVGVGVAPHRDEIIQLQSQLRSAGFDPGPVDGVFGNRTKSVISRVQSGCLMARDLNGRLEVALRSEKRELSLGSLAEAQKPSAAAPQPPTVMMRTDGVRASVATQTPRPQEEIRILQLRLRDAGFDPGPFDGVMGQKTKLALQQYEESQRNKKLKTSLSSNIRGMY